MSTSIGPLIAQLIQEAARIEAESERVYLSLARIFPRLASELSRSADVAGASLDQIKGLLTEGALRRDQRDSSDSSDFFRSLHERDSAFLARINDSIKRLGSLDEVISRVRLDSEEMEIVSLNAMTVALKSGVEGKAFSVITDELKRLSGRTIGLTDNVTNRGSLLMESFGTLRASLGDLDAFQSEFFESVDRILVKGFQHVERELSSSFEFFRQLLDEARQVRDPVQRVMQEIQLQDIVRQSLQHVGISLREAEDASGSDADGGGTAFIAAVIELSAGLVDEVVGKLNASAESFRRDMDSVQSVVRDCEGRRREHLESGKNAEIVDASSFSESSTRYLGLTRDIIATARRLSSQVQGLDESFKGISALLSRFQTIVVASRIEVAKNRALQSVATTVGGMIALTASIESDVSEAMDTTKEFIKVAVAAIAEYAQESEGSGAHLVKALEQVESDLQRLESARGSVREVLGGFLLYTPDFISLLSEAGTELGRLTRLADGLQSVRTRLAGLLADLNHEPGGAIVGEQAERLKRMVERFTIFTHKKTAGEIGKFAVEDGSAAGEVTLF
ncbi:MAG TPA: hypothetical protein VMC79_00660 [Rectinemataceae bacterium]|nr:hypothetical protein [Rectinemataceae bacterium]